MEVTYEKSLKLLYFFLFFFFKLYIIVLVLPNIIMDPPQEVTLMRSFTTEFAISLVSSEVKLSALVPLTFA